MGLSAPSLLILVLRLWAGMVNLGYGILKVHLQRIARKGSDGVHRLPTVATIGDCCQGHCFLIIMRVRVCRYEIELYAL